MGESRDRSTSPRGVIDKDAYQELDSRWRRVRDLESSLGEDLLTSTEDPRCQALADGKAFRLVCDAVDQEAYLIPGLLSLQEQCDLLNALLTDWALPPHRSNLCQSSEASWLKDGLKKFCEESMDQSSLSVIERLRWVTLGQQYDWSSRSYLSDERPLPELLVSFASRAVELLRLAGEIHSMPRFQAAICNLYHAARRPSDRLGGHRDDVEEDATSPLVTISIGLPCVFLLGKDTRTSRPLPLLFTAGSMLVLTKRARQAFHGVPSIFVPPKLQLKGRSFRPATSQSWDPRTVGTHGARGWHLPVL
ncbi:unnamed protein product [Durusdinium trenchii]|uniref:Fe2OG dioxygenase domain-containing protein n=1 Tax=Durusdinium trenchii TaxID=1381693 RepID=A0ABP0Q841_9DINO